MKRKATLVVLVAGQLLLLGCDGSPVSRATTVEVKPDLQLVTTNRRLEGGRFVFDLRLANRGLNDTFIHGYPAASAACAYSNDAFVDIDIPTKMCQDESEFHLLASNRSPSVSNSVTGSSTHIVVARGVAIPLRSESGADLHEVQLSCSVTAFSLDGKTTRLQSCIVTKGITPTEMVDKDERFGDRIDH